MASRYAASYNVPYNPQDWGPMGTPVTQAQYPPTTNALRIAPQQSTQAGRFFYDLLIDGMACLLC